MRSQWEPYQVAVALVVARGKSSTIATYGELEPEPKGTRTPSESTVKD